MLVKSTGVPGEAFPRKLTRQRQRRICSAFAIKREEIVLISTRGRYALRVMIDLAEHRNGGYIPMKEVARRQEISLKYIERLMPALKAAGLVESVHGIGGGYRLTREPDEYSVGEILRQAEGDLAPVSCLGCDAKPCSRASECRTLPMWQKYYELTKSFFDGISLSDLMANGAQADYVI